MNALGDDQEDGKSDQEDGKCHQAEPDPEPDAFLQAPIPGPPVPKPRMESECYEVEQRAQRRHTRMMKLPTVTAPASSAAKETVAEWAPKSQRAKAKKHRPHEIASKKVKKAATKVNAKAKAKAVKAKSERAVKSSSSSSSASSSAVQNIIVPGASPKQFIDKVKRETDKALVKKTAKAKAAKPAKATPKAEAAEDAEPEFHLHDFLDAKHMQIEKENLEKAKALIPAHMRTLSLEQLLKSEYYDTGMRYKADGGQWWNTQCPRRSSVTGAPFPCSLIGWCACGLFKRNLRMAYNLLKKYKYIAKP